MENIADTVREKLIIEGIAEIERSGIKNFSLRRVARDSNVSCAAPYKHFNSKNDFIFEIVRYIYTKWNLVTSEIIKIYENEPQKQISEICISYIKFWLANPNFRSVLMMGNEELSNVKEISPLTQVTKNLILKHYSNLSEELINEKVFNVRAISYGAILMIDKGEIENTPESINMIRRSINKCLEE